MTASQESPRASPLIELRGISKSFSARGSETKALGPIDLRVAKEEFVALVGPSGCGKSTVLNLVAGLLSPTEGELFYENKLIHGANHRVGYMTQKDTLLPWRTVEDNIGIALELKCRATSREERRDRIAKFTELVGLKGFERHYPGELSGGMRKRAALARLLVYEPETLLLDEPFGALDAQLKLVMLQELLRLTQLQKMTVMFVTHDLTEAISLANTVLVFTGRPGQIRARRTIDLPKERDVQEIRFRPEFNALYEDLWTELKDEVGKGTDA